MVYLSTGPLLIRSKDGAPAMMMSLSA